MHEIKETIRMLETVKWGFIGCGEVTEKKSGPAFSEVEGSTVVAVMSRTENVHEAMLFAMEYPNGTQMLKSS